jgi:hypothetical membrane protein
MKLLTKLVMPFLLTCGIIGPLLCVTVFLIEGVTRPAYNPWRSWISELSLGDQGWINIANLTISGLLILGFALALQRVFPSGPASRWGPRLVALFAVSLFLAGVFVIDPNGHYPPNIQPTISLHGIIHKIVAPLIFISSSAACFVVARRFATEWYGKRWVRYSRVTGVLIPTSFMIGNILAGLDFAGILPNAPSGLFQRIALIGACIWLALLALHLLRRTYLQGMTPPVIPSLREEGAADQSKI